MEDALAPRGGKDDILRSDPVGFRDPNIWVRGAGSKAKC
jgi:hypothetical protein